MALSRTALSLRGALIAYVGPRLATDQAGKIDIGSIVAKVTRKTLAADKARVVTDTLAAVKGKLAKDAQIDTKDLEKVVDVIGMLSDEGAETMDEMLPNAGVPAVGGTADASGLTPEEEAQYQALCAKRGSAATGDDDLGGMDDDDPAEKKRKEEEAKKKAATDAAEAAEKEKQMNKDRQGARDRAALVKDAREGALKEIRVLRQAEADVRPLVGDVSPDITEPVPIYQGALKAEGIDTRVTDIDALRAMTKMAVDAKKLREAGGNSFEHQLAADSANGGTSDAVTAFRKEIGETRQMRNAT